MPEVPPERTPGAEEPDEPALPLAPKELAQFSPDPMVRRVLLHALRMLTTDESSPELQEFATEVLAGRATLRDAVLSSAYTDVFGERARSFLDWYQSTSEEERAEGAARAEEHFSDE